MSRNDIHRLAKGGEPPHSGEKVRKAYEPPRLRYLGAVRELTLASKKGSFAESFGSKAIRG